jgi:hypothetical protein
MTIDEFAAVKRAIASVVRETLNLARTEPNREKVRVQAKEYAEQLILPSVTALREQALEDGFNQGRASAPAEAL